MGPKCKSCLPPTLRQAVLLKVEGLGQNQACEAAKLAIRQVGDSKNGPVLTQNRAKMRPAKGKRGCAGPKIPENPHFFAIFGPDRGGGSREAQIASNPRHTGRNSLWASKMRGLYLWCALLMYLCRFCAHLPVGAPCYNFITALDVKQLRLAHCSDNVCLCLVSR